MGDSLASLPSNVWEIIVSFLDGLSLSRLASTCAWFYNFVETTCDWRQVVQRIPKKAIPSIVHVSPDSCEFHSNTMESSICRKISVIGGGLSLISSLSRCQSHTNEQRQKSSQITATNFCCGYLITGCLDGSVGIFEPITMRRVKYCHFLHDRQVTSVFCYCRSWFRKFPSLIISTSEDTTIKFTRYDCTYLKVSDPWTLPLLQPITCAAKYGNYLLTGHENGDVQLIMIRFGEENFSDEGKQKVSATISALRSYNRREKAVDVALSDSTAVACFFDRAVEIYEIAFDDVPAVLLRPVQVLSSLPAAIIMELLPPETLEYSVKMADDYLENVVQSVLYANVLICVDGTNELFAVQVTSDRAEEQSTKTLRKVSLGNFETKTEPKNLAFGMNAQGFVASVCSYEDRNVCHTISLLLFK